MNCFDIATIVPNAVICNAVIANFESESVPVVVEGVHFQNCMFEGSVYYVDFKDCKFEACDSDFYFDRVNAYKGCVFV